MNILKKSLLFLILWVACVTAWAQYPTVRKYAFEDKSFVTRMSDNGRWGVTESGDGESVATPKVVDLNSGKATNIGSTASSQEITHDVTNDGTIVVGSSAEGKPAYWSKADGSWHALEMVTSQANCKATGLVGGMVFVVTPDGKYAVGQLSDASGYAVAPALWDLTTGKTIATPNLPTKDMAHIDQKQMRFDAISADGRYILGEMSMSYLPGTGEGNSEAELGGLFAFVYDVQAATYKAIGFTESETSRWKSDYDGCFVVDGGYMSNNGKWITGACRIWRAEDENTDYYCPYVYNVETGKFTVYEDDATMGNTATAISNNGTPLMASPEGNPYRNWSIFDGNKYWYKIEDVLQQKWSMDLMGEQKLDNTGTPDGISDDGMRVLATPTYADGDSYILDLTEPISEVYEGATMLGSYTASPAQSSVVSEINSLKVTFNQNIKVIPTGSFVTLEDEDDNVLATATKNMADGKNLDITFRKGKAKLVEGKTYYVHVPAGTIAMENADDQVNDDIYVEYIGRKDAPVSCTNIAPKDGTSVAKVDVNTNPITLDFDTNISIAADETRKAYIYRGEETEPYATLNFYYGKNQVVIAPSTTVNLFKENDYRIVVPAGIITDVAGNGANEEISFTYHGAYERTISYDDANLFKNDFDTRDITTAFMLYDGDQNKPADTPKEWGFNYSLPWWFARDAGSTDYAAVSHSMYSPAGKSEDWMVIPQLYIPDGVCELQFQGQSYLNGKDDYLKVYVWESDNIYNNLTKDIVEKIKSEGNLEFNELLNPGATEEGLANEWTDYTVDLKKYAGKNIYIAFYNGNEDQSAIFLNNIYVKHNVPVLISVDNEESIINKSEVKISGSFAANLEDKTINDVKLTLTDANDKAIDTQTFTNLGLKKGYYEKFAFEKPLPLTVGVTNTYKILMEVDGEQTQITKTMNDLVFQPIKRVVLEEYTGRDCVNCPLGIVAIDNLKKRFDDKFLPIAIHGYTGDPLGVGLEAYYGYLKLNEAPSATIDRSETIYYPTVSAGTGNYYLSAAAVKEEMGLETDDLWSDYVEKEILKSPEAEVTATIDYDEATHTIKVPASVRYAMNAENQNVNLFAVLVEQEVPAAYQKNDFASINSDVLLPWSAGGKYASAYVTDFNYEDVCRGTWGNTYMGTSGLLPSTIVAGQEYKVNDIQFVLPEKTDIKANDCQVIVMMIDANTGKYINAIRTATIGETTGIQDAVVDKANVNDNAAWYTLSGMKLNGKPTTAGIYVHNGKKYVVK